MIENGQPDGGFLLCYGGCSIPFRLIQDERSTLKIDVHPDLRVEVFAPAGKEKSTILKRVERRAQWIVKQWRYFEQFQPEQPERRYVSGETHIYLGRQYRLKVTQNERSEVKLVGPYFRIHHSDPGDTAAISGMLTKWYADHARELFAARIDKWIAECHWLSGLETPAVQIRVMKRRWGSCTKAGQILLNPDLVKVPLHCVDYVVVHELCHLRVHAHSPAFYRLLGRCLPDWERRKQRLEWYATSLGMVT
jgi:predicted metal-dependent hydrolase